MEVIWQPKAVKQLKKIGDRSVQQRILTASRGLADFNSCPNIKVMVDHQYSHRLRVGDWRLLLNFFEEVSVVSIEEVKKRDEHTY
jgi:mRNA-degrading endonuclease RelE of RelBE toxin-antitoxin system